MKNKELFKKQIFRNDIPWIIIWTTFLLLAIKFDDLTLTIIDSMAIGWNLFELMQDIVFYYIAKNEEEEKQ